MVQVPEHCVDVLVEGTVVVGGELEVRALHQLRDLDVDEEQEFLLNAETVIGHAASARGHSRKDDFGARHGSPFRQG